MAENTITSFFVALCLVCLWITATQLLNFLTESSQCYREATRVEDNDCATLKDCIHRAKFVVEDAKVSSYKALRLILLSAVFSVAGMQVGGYISAVGILWYLETMAENVSAGSYMSCFPVGLVWQCTWLSQAGTWCCFGHFFSHNNNKSLIHCG